MIIRNDIDNVSVGYQPSLGFQRTDNGFIGTLFTQFLQSATTEFLNLQSGNARPYFYIEALISGQTSVIGTSYTATNWLIDGGIIAREKPAFPGDRSSIFQSDVTIKVDNSTNRFSPLYTSSVFYGQQYINSPFNYWAGFVNVSGTALLIQRGSFLLQNISIDSRENVAHFRLVDRFRKALDSRIGSSDVSGTAIQLTFTGNQGPSDIIRSLFVTGAGLINSDLDIGNSLGSFNNISLSEQSVAEAASLIAEASDSYLFTSRKGILTFKSNAPTFGFMSLANLTATNSGQFSNLRFEEDFGDRVKKIVFEYASGTSLFVTTETPSNTGNAIKLSNDAISSIGDVQAITTRLIDRFSGSTVRLTIDSIWLPSIEIGDKISIYDPVTSITGSIYELYKIEEEPTNNRMTLYLINEKSEGKWGFVSDNSAVVCGTLFTGSTSELNGWQAGWAFVGRDTGTAVNPGFDLEGNNNNVINANVTSSGIGGTGIELLFQTY